MHTLICALNSNGLSLLKRQISKRI
uniref:Uncharacterized protein n=1 Tax=Anguilla anguilla TaxID=7936 RepID=A0A0E9R3U7_ANGAN